MRKITIEFIIPEECEKDYDDTCTELTAEDFVLSKLDHDIEYKIISDIKDGDT